MRYYLIDKVTELRPGEGARGVKSVSLSDEVLHDHFPDYPTLPGALLVEGAAQLGGFFLEMSLNTQGAPLRRALLAQIKDARFYERVGPGTLVDVAVTLESTLGDAAQLRAEARAGEALAMRALLTFVLKEIPSERVHEQRRYVYRLWTSHFDPPPTIL
jgi:3-hydroxyacyl-[acyl-carrier-protein] dehydratase